MVKIRFPRLHRPNPPTETESMVSESVVSEPMVSVRDREFCLRCYHPHIAYFQAPHSPDDAFAAKHMPDLGHDIKEFQVFHWELHGWKGLEKKLTSPEFDCGGHKWRILLYPFGNVSIPNEVVSVYLDFADPTWLEEGWHPCAQYALAISNPHDPTIYTVRHTHRRFTATVCNWGFPRFAEFDELFSDQRGNGRPTIEGGSAVVSVYVRVSEDPTGTLWCDPVNNDSDKQMGYVCPENQSAMGMSNLPGLHNRKGPILVKIYSLLLSLTTEPAEYDQVAPKVEYWIEYVLRENFATDEELVERLSYMAWEDGRSYANVARFFKEFRDAPARSEQARSFVTQLCTHVIRWFAIAAVEPLSPGWSNSSSIASGGGNGFIRAASFVGYLVKYDLLNQEIVRQHLMKPLTNHYDGHNKLRSGGPVRASAVYQLFIAAGDALFQGLFEPEDIRLGFEMLDARCGRIEGYDASRIKELREIHQVWLRRGDKAQQEKTQECRLEGEETRAPGIPTEVETPVTFVPQGLPAVTGVIAPPPYILEDIKPPSVSRHVESLSETFVNIPAATISSPASSTSIISDLASTELCEETEHSEKEIHGTFYFEDGNVEIVCGRTLFRVHSTIVSLSSPKLRDVLSPSALQHSPTPQGHPRVSIRESAEDFETLLKMIYTPGFPARHEVPGFTVFASLLRMTTKYGFSDVRDQLIKDFKGAYPTRWKDFRTTKTLGEDVFGSPKPHPNAVLNLFMEQNIKFAIPFAAYRASIGGFSALMSDEPGAVLSRRTLATTIHGMHVMRSMASHAARAIAYGGNLRTCADEECILKTDIEPTAKRMELQEKIHNSMIAEREGGVLTPPSLGYLCSECAENIETVHAQWRSLFWENLPSLFAVSDSWRDL